MLVAILGQGEDEQAGGPALLHACGLTSEQASQLATTLLPARAEAAVPEAEPRVVAPAIPRPTRERPHHQAAQA